MPTTTYMLLVLPTPGTSNDFTGETQTITAFGLIDAHDHSPGKGTLVPTTGLNINADLPFAGFNASGLRSVRLNSQGSTLALLLDVNSIYSSGGNLYFNNGSGQAVQITSGSTLSASSIGGISGLAAPASVAYSGGSYVFTSNTNIAAIVDTGPIIIRDTGVSARGITLQSPTGLAAAYAITLPAALPASAGLLSLSSVGALSAFGTVSGSNLTLAGQLAGPGFGGALTGANSTPVALSPNTNITAGFGAAYWKDVSGIVHLKGKLTNNTGGVAQNLVTTSPLPAGFRPAVADNQRIFACPGLGSRTYMVYVDSSGNIGCTIASDTTAGIVAGDGVYIDGIHFLASV